MNTQNKSNRWLDVQIVIVTMALTFSLALWNLFAGDNRSDNSGNPGNDRTGSTGGKGLLTSVSNNPAPQTSGPIYLGGAAPQSQPYYAPAPVTSTGSSRP